MRVLLLSWEYPPLVYGGLGRHVHALSEALVAAGHEVTVVTQTGGDHNVALDEVTRAGVRVVRVPEDPPLVHRDDLMAWIMAFNHAITRAALRVAHESAYDVVHAHDWLVAHSAATVKETLGLPLVATMHATEAGRHQGWLPSPLSKAIHSVEWWLTFEARRVITCSSYMRWEVTRLFDLPPDKVDVVPNGVIEVPSRRRAPSTPTVVYAGRLEYEKGVQTLLRAVPRLKRRHPGLRVVIAGTGTYTTGLQDLAKELKVGKAVEFIGHVDRSTLATLFAAASAVVVPSIYEPFGMVALEASIAGAPIIVSDTGGLRELVDHGVDGLRVPSEDVPALADAISTLVKDQVLASRLARAAKARARREHHWDAIAAKTLDTYARAEREERALQAQLAGRPVSRPSLRMVVRDGNLLAER
ncbi:MAG TPA: glycosyltransferase family 4 protein [Mycobacteriales bacterium]|nr:glycosyltransferase family 4 protein [Mycobacteriales bacterium]